MRALRLTRDAIRDLELIQEDGVSRFGADRSLRHMAGFRRVFTLLRERPHAGPPRPEFGDGVRTFLHRPHRVIYRIEDEVVVISRIVDTAQVDLDSPLQ